MKPQSHLFEEISNVLLKVLLNGHNMVEVYLNGSRVLRIILVTTYVGFCNRWLFIYLFLYFENTF